VIIRKNPVNIDLIRTWETKFLKSKAADSTGI